MNLYSGESVLDIILAEEGGAGNEEKKLKTLKKNRKENLY